MFLADHDRHHALARVQTAFPFFTQWPYTTAAMKAHWVASPSGGNGCYILKRPWLDTSLARSRHMPSTGVAISPLASVLIDGRVPTWGMPTFLIPRRA